eukprot:TRINITY_DN4854_c0_g3_i2.p1 TRINITY_DN4854_c0_g3~~TRINITY_DN4854_c0_g3_i2.p1  ORF type:complete len:394 (-),score=124.69 TRINITY_DN4854_c0_g3_i2:951-2060(-)
MSQQINICNSMNEFEIFKAIGAGARSCVYEAECKTMRTSDCQEEQEGGEIQTMQGTIQVKHFAPEMFFKSAAILDSNASEEEKFLTISEDQLSPVYERFCEAAQFLSEKNLEHKSLLQIKGVVAPRDNLSHFGVVSESFEAVSLERLVSSPEGCLQLEAIPAVTKLQRLLDIASALNALHAEDLLHRNLKNSNVLFSPAFDQVKLSDYALDVLLVRVPKESEEEEEEEGEGEEGEEENDAGDDEETEDVEEEKALLKVSELPKLVSPPELLAGAVYNEASDIYCFSMVAWQLLACQPVQSPTDDQTNLIQQIVRKDLRQNLSELDARLPEQVQQDVKQLLADCWNRKLDSRPDAETICARLAEIISKLQ